MYESQRPVSLGETGVPEGWQDYFHYLPQKDSFNSLMFWSAAELAELQGSTVVHKVGKEEAEKDFEEVVLPFVRKYPDVFGDAGQYTLDLFHHMGSLVLSRSFHVESTEDSDEEGDSDEEEEEEESVGDVAMVPLADLLNAVSTHSNARLFYTPTTLEMRSTAAISAGAQIFNTYADPPNSDLLRRYGHVEESNSNDLVEVGLEMVVDLVGVAMGLDEEEREKRAEWLLEMGIEEYVPYRFQRCIRTEALSRQHVFHNDRSFDP